MKEKFSYAKSIDICEKALDMLDVKKFLIQGKEVRNIMWAIEEYYDNPLSIDTDEIECFMKEYPEVFGENNPEIFNYMTEDEFLNYCRKRYPEIHWNYEFIERHWVK